MQWVSKSTAANNSAQLDVILNPLSILKSLTLTAHTTALGPNGYFA